jgi:mannose-1-phosphate guanylyltransferase
MKALLLAAGLGTRLRPLTLEIPKCLVPLKGRPLMDYWLEMLCASPDIDAVLVNLHYMPDKVIQYLETSLYREKVSMVFEEELLGTGGTLLKNRDFFGTGPVLMIHGDNFSIFSMDRFLSAHAGRPEHCEITMMTFRTDTPESCGIVELDEHSVVRAFHEKVKNPPGNLANGAVYILENSIFDFLESIGREKIDFSTQVLPEFTGKIFTFFNDQYHRDIGTMENYKKARERL